MIMKEYVLKDNETILFRGNAILMPNGKRIETDKEKCDVVLTNLNIVLIEKVKKLFRTVNQANVFSVSDVKIYDETIQIIRRKAIVDIYLKKGELFLDFEKEKAAKEFCDKALKLISGNSKLVRAVKKAQKAIRETNEALDIDMVGIAKSAATVACETVVAIETPNVSKKASIVGKAAKIFLGKSNKTETKTLAEAKEKGEEEIIES